MIESPWLRGRDRYDRTLEGWTDNTHDDAFTHTVRISDGDFGLEASAVCTPPPAYEIRQASARALDGSPAPGSAERFSGIRGTRMVGGFAKALLEIVGSGEGSDLLAAAGMELARLGRQVAKLPEEATRGLRKGDARRYWELDNIGWTDLPNSCFAYRPQTKALFDTRAVTTALPPEIYVAPSGAKKIFCRKKLIRMVRTGSRLHLFNSLHDNAHGFDLHYEIDLDSDRIVAVDLICSRLPYLGICDEPQAKITAMKGQRVDGLLRKNIQTMLGGESGCTQIFDLTSDLLKLLALS
jgi:hypothetical protein